MKILVVSGVAKKAQVLEVNVIPRKGDEIDMFYQPFPVVNKVIFWPKSNTLSELGVYTPNIGAIVLVD